MKSAAYFFDTPYFYGSSGGNYRQSFPASLQKIRGGAVYSEMISAKGMYYNDKITENC